MQSPDVGLFVDFENIRYSVLNTYRREVSGAMLMDIGRKLGGIAVARAFADFSAHPVRVLRDLQISGIQPVDTAPQAGSDRSRGAGDLEMAIDVFETLLDRPHLETYVLMTGDRRFLRIVTMICNRFGKQVVISGVRGSVSNDLIEAAAGRFEPLEFLPVEELIRLDAFLRFIDRLERSKPFITFKYVAAAMSTSREFPGLTESEAREAVSRALEEGLLVKTQREDGYRVIHLNRDRDDLREILASDRISTDAEEDENFEEPGRDLPPHARESEDTHPPSS